jgi:small subunit ribosomal protein S20
LANSPQARKRAKQAAVSRTRNIAQRSSMRTSIKRFIGALESNDLETAKTTYRELSSKVDRAARKGLTHPNRAARLKGRLNARLKAKVAA